MSKSVKKVLKIVGIAALVVATGGIGLALATGGTIAGATVGVFGATVSALTLASAGVALYGIGSAPNPPRLEQTGANSRGVAVADPNALGVYVFGKTIVPSVLVFEQVYGTNSDQVANVFAHAWHEIESYESLHVDGEEVSFSGDSATGDYAGILTWTRKTGAPSQTAIALTDTDWPASTPKFAGVAHSSMIWVFRDQDKLKGGVPNHIEVEVKGAMLYDPRLDNTYGSGTQEFADPSTWTWNDGNAVLVLLRYLIGEYVEGGTDLIWGRGVEATELDMDNWIAMANVCDETLDDTVRFKLGGAWPLSGDFEAFVRMWEEETGGKLYKDGGKYLVWVPHDDLTALTTIDEDDLLRDTPIEYAEGNIANLYNTARGRYIEPTEGYRGFPYPEVSESTAVTDDGRKRLLTQDFSWVQERSLAERISRIKVRRTRFQRMWTFAMGWPGQGPNYKPFTVHTLNLPETGDADVLVRVVDRRRAFNGVTVLTVQEENSAIYSDTDDLGTAHTSNSSSGRIDRLGTVVPRFIDGTAINDERGLWADTQHMLPNWRFNSTDSDGKPAGIRGVSSISDRSQLQFGGLGIQILSTPDTLVEYGFPAIPVDDRETYSITINHLSSAASDGLVLEMLEFDGPLTAGRTHVGSGSGEAMSTSGFTSSVTLLSGNMPGTSETPQTFSYTPTAGTKFATFAMAVNNPSSAGVVYEVRSVQMSRQGNHEIAADVTGDHADDVIFRQATTPTSPQAGWIWIDSDDNRTYRYSGSAWVFMGAVEDGAGLSGAGPVSKGISTTTGGAWVDYVEFTNLEVGDIVLVTLTFGIEITSAGTSPWTVQAGIAISVNGNTPGAGEVLAKTTTALEQRSHTEQITITATGTNRIGLWLKMGQSSPPGILTASVTNYSIQYGVLKQA